MPLHFVRWCIEVNNVNIRVEEWCKFSINSACKNVTLASAFSAGVYIYSIYTQTVQSITKDTHASLWLTYWAADDGYISSSHSLQQNAYRTFVIFLKSRNPKNNVKMKNEDEYDRGKIECVSFPKDFSHLSMPHSKSSLVPVRKMLHCGRFLLW